MIFCGNTTVLIYEYLLLFRVVILKLSYGMKRHRKKYVFFSLDAQTCQFLYSII